mgnify:CR=1 FL=1
MAIQNHRPPKDVKIVENMNDLQIKKEFFISNNTEDDFWKFYKCLKMLGEGKPFNSRLLWWSVGVRA